MLGLWPLTREAAKLSQYTHGKLTLTSDLADEKYHYILIKFFYEMYSFYNLNTTENIKILDIYLYNVLI